MRETVLASPDGDVNKLADDWRVYPLDFGQSVVAFRSVTWRLKDGPPPPTPVRDENTLISSTARAYGLVDGKLVMVRIDSNSPEPPSEERLRALWDAQVAKVRFHNALSRNHEVQSTSTDSTDPPASW
ncbi:MAG: hypothetical protein Q4C87_12205 [Actinomycetaceae bacterium]|nr:hypothetical protein [Actinomycetaceae bacterium]